MNKISWSLDNVEIKHSPISMIRVNIVKRTDKLNRVSFLESKQKQTFSCVFYKSNKSFIYECRSHIWAQTCGKR